MYERQLGLSLQPSSEQTRETGGIGQRPWIERVTALLRRSARNLLAILGLAVFAALFPLTLWADVAPRPYFEKLPKDSISMTISDQLSEVSPRTLFLVAGGLIVVMEGLFLVGLIRTRKKHVDK